MDAIEQNLRAELESAESISQSVDYDVTAAEARKDDEAHLNSLDADLQEKLENKKKELVCIYACFIIGFLVINFCLPMFV